MRGVAILTAILLVALPLWHGDASAAGLSIEPGGLLLQDVPVGEARSVVESSGIPFVVHNRDGIEHEYHIAALRPSQAGNGRWAKGYAEIPDASWIRPVPDRLVIPPGETGTFDLVIEVPDDGRLYNQKWAVTLAVEGAPAPGTNIAIALYPSLQIETQARRGGARPLGSVAVAPSTLRADAGGEPAAFTIYNNDSRAHGYLIHVLPPGGTVSASPGYESASADGLVRPRPRRLRVEAGGAELVRLDVKPCAMESDERSWEQIVFVESEAGECTFVRLQMSSE